MSKDKLFERPGIAIQLAQSKSKKGEAEAVTDEIQIIRTGIYQHAWYGEFEISESILAAFVENFEKNVMQNDLMIDYNHDVKPAAAWIEELFLKNGTELWAKVQWTPAGKKAVEDKEYRYISADFHWNHTDNETGIQYGPTLYGAALTNRPFVKGMAPTVELNETNGGIQMTLEELKKQNAQLSERAEKAEKAQADQTAQLKSLTEQTTTLSEQVKTLTEENKKLQDGAALSKKESEFAVLLSEGKACPAQKDAFMKGDMTEFAKLAQPVKLNAQGTPAKEGEADPAPAGDEDEAITLAEKKLKDGSAPDMATALSLVFKEKPELRK